MAHTIRHESDAFFDGIPCRDVLRRLKHHGYDAVCDGASVRVLDPAKNTRGNGFSIVKLRDYSQVCRFIDIRSRAWTA